jgi:putative ABC transport system permease protein
MKHLPYIFRNARRNPVRTILTIASTSICLFLMTILLAFFAINNEVAEESRIYNRIVVMNANGFAGMVPVSCVSEISKMDGVVAATPFSWYGGKYQEEAVPFSQFAVDAEAIFNVMDELKVPPAQLKEFKEYKDGCVIGQRLAMDRRLKVGDPLPLKGDYFPVDLSLTIRGIYSGPHRTDQRMCLFHFDYFDEALKRSAPMRTSRSSASVGNAFSSGNAGTIFVKCKNADIMPSLNKKIDSLYRNSDYPTRTQTEEAFGKMFADMLGDLKTAIQGVGVAVVVALLFVSGNAMAMAMRERTTEIAVLKAIGFSKGLVLFLVLAEAVLVAGSGGALGTLGSKAFCDFVDISQYTGGFLPFFYVSWNITLFGLGVSLFVGFASGVIPALMAANSSVVNGLRKVV